MKWIVYKAVFKLTIAQFVLYSDNFAVGKTTCFANCID